MWRVLGSAVLTIVSGLATLFGIVLFIFGGMFPSPDREMAQARGFGVTAGGILGVGIGFWLLRLAIRFNRKL
jgi:hypothetical protein